MPKISIAIPVYNTEKYLRECLDSLLNQTLGDFEAICVNDGSTDNSLEILQEYAKKDSRFIIIDKENEGQGVARNIAIQKAQGEYLMCLDSDDWLENNALELLYNKIKNDNCDILFFNFYKYIEKTKAKYIIKFTEIFKNFKDKPFTQEEAGKLIFKTNALTYKIYKLDFIKNNNIEYSNSKFMEDVTFYVKTLLYAKRFSCLSIPLYNYRIIEKSASTNYKNYLTDTPKICETCFKYIKDFENNKILLNSFLENRKNSMLHFYEKIPFYKKRQYYKMMQELIEKYYMKYETDEQLKNIFEYSFLKYWFLCKIKVFKYILGTYGF